SCSFARILDALGGRSRPRGRPERQLVRREPPAADRLSGGRGTSTGGWTKASESIVLIAFGARRLLRGRRDGKVHRRPGWHAGGRPGSGELFWGCLRQCDF